MEIGHLIPHIEALIFASDKPLTGLELTDLINNAFGFMEDKIVLDQVESALEGIVEKYRSEFYPFEVRESGGGWQFLTKRDYHKTVAQLNGEKFLKRLSTAALEALSIIAYKQPVTKAEIEAIRGVSSDYAIQKLLEKELIVITGRNENMPGHPLVYGTSKNFMDYFGINSAEDLPKLKEVFDETIVNATNVTEAIAQQQAGEEGAADVTTDEEAPLAVAENGELIEGNGGGDIHHLNGESVAFETEEGEAAEDNEAAGEAGSLNEAAEDEATEEDDTNEAIEEDEADSDEDAGEDDEEEAGDGDGEDENEDDEDEEYERDDDDEEEEDDDDEEEEGDEDGEQEEDDENNEDEQDGRK